MQDEVSLVSRTPSTVQLFMLYIITFTYTCSFLFVNLRAFQRNYSLPIWCAVIKYDVQNLSMYKIDSFFKISKYAIWNEQNNFHLHRYYLLALVQIELQMVIFSTSYYLRELG